MERLTKKTAGGYVLKMPTDKSISDLEIKFNVYDKLGKYEDAEEQGLLLKFPCKVGDTVYRIDTDERLRSVEIENHTIENIVISNWGDILFKYDAYDGVICALENITKGTLYLDFYRVFLTKEEAEQALKQMGE